MARIDFGAKPLSYPQPVLIIAAYDGDGRANAMNAAWGGITGSDELTICVSPGHKTVKDLRQTGDFTVSMGDAAHVTACDYLGIASGNTTEDKLARAGFTVTKSRFVNAPGRFFQILSTSFDTCRGKGRKTAQNTSWMSSI